MSARHTIDATCAVGLFVLTAVLALWAQDQFRRSPLRPTFYQEFFAPAVMFACGHGFRNVEWSGDPALSAFLRLNRDTLACGDLGRGLAGRPLDYFQSMSLYLEWAVALTWRVGGVSWVVLSWLGALLAGAFAAMVYGVMRLGMRPVIAAIVSVVVVTSPLHLNYVPHLRDYSKAPFLLALLLLTGIAVKRTLSRRPLLALSVLAGVIAGIGFGFRTDLLVAAVPFVAALFVFRAGPLTLRARTIDGALASVVFLTAFTLAAAPVIARFAKGGTIAHVMLLGFSGGFSAALGVEAKHYDLNQPYSDWFQEMVVRSYASRHTGDAHMFSVTSEEYDRESSRYLMEVVATFPADVAVRASSAILRILNAPFSPELGRATSWVHSPLIHRAYDRRADALERAGVLGWAASAIVIAGAAMWSMRLAAFLAFVVAFFAGSTAIQFNARHFFYLEFMSWWAIGAIVDRVVSAGRAIPQFVRAGAWRSRETLAAAGAAVARSAALVVVLVLASSAALGATRRYQQRTLDRLFERTLAASTQPLSVATRLGDADHVTMTVDLPELALAPESWERRAIGTAYLVIDLNPQRCDSASFSARLRYDAGLNGVEFTAPVTVPLIDPQLGSSIKIVAPVYAAWFPRMGHQEAQFTGIDLAGRDAPCVASISKLGDPAAFPVLVTAVLAPDWRTAWHYQTMIDLESREDGALWRERFYPMPSAPDVSRSVLWEPPTDSWEGGKAFSPVVTAAPPSGLTVAGTPESATAYLFASRVREVPRGSCALAEGELTAGGLTIGLLRSGAWYQQVGIVERGRFLAVGCAQEDGSYSILVANNNPRGATAARFTKIGWVRPGGRPAVE